MQMRDHLPMNRREWTLISVGMFVILAAILLRFLYDARTGTHLLGSNPAMLATVFPTLTPTPTPIPTQIPTPTDIPRIIINLGSMPSDLLEGDTATFSWAIYGVSATIDSTTVYYGTTSTPGSLAESVVPSETAYRYDVPDFKRGAFAIPMKFIGNSKLPTSGTYYARAYLRFGGKHLWSDEVSFLVSPKAKHTITVVNYPHTLPHEDNATFTWQIAGPVATSYYTVIVGGTTSLSGSLGYDKTLGDTPYQLLVADFARGTYPVPYQFVGNAKISQSGTYYFRALSVIGDKNIWSDEHSMTIQ
jgi:hypothetical protein